MKKIYYYLPMAAIALGLSSCDGAKKDAAKVTFNVAGMDTTAAPGASFFQYATGNWTKDNPIPDDRSRYGSFDKLAENNIEQVKTIITEIGATNPAEGTVARKIADLYAIAMDSAKLNADGAEPIKAQLAEIKELKTTQDIIKMSAKLSTYTTSPFFAFYVSTDAKSSEENLPGLYQSGLSLGLRDYYLDTDDTSVSIREGYKALIEKQFINAGFPEAEAKNAVTTVLRIETAIAKAHIKKEDMRNPEKNYNKVKVSDLDKIVGKFDWKLFFSETGAKDFDQINIGQFAPIAAAVKLLQTTPIEDTKIYLSWLLIDGSASYLSDAFADANFDFYGKILSGKLAQSPRWKRSVSTTQSVLSEAVGQVYVEKYFPAEAKERMIQLVKNLQVTLGERITNLEWMSEETKVQAHEKLNSFKVKIGYPDKWRDYSALEVKSDSYWANIMRANDFNNKKMLDKIGQPVDKEEWHMPPQMVNAYYSPVSNEICFPAGILQAPFFYLDGDDAVNYGAIGVVIGHEMSHGFDDQGSKFDKNGNMKNWWTDADAKKFTERAQVLVDHFSSIEILPSVMEGDKEVTPKLMGNGKYTLGENIGDFGGLQIAYNAFAKTEQAKATQNIDGFTPQQRFFLSYANVWAGSAREAEIRRLTQVDVHSLSNWRVDGMLPQINAWYDAFGITEKDPLYIAPEKRADIW